MHSMAASSEALSGEVKATTSLPPFSKFAVTIATPSALNAS